MDIKFKRRFALIKQFNEIQISRRDLMKIKKMHIENERTKLMKSKNNKVNVPVNVLAEPVFNSEIEAYTYYAEKYDIENIKEYAEIYVKYKKIPKITSKQTEADKTTKLDYTNIQKDLSTEIRDKGLKNEYIKKFNVELQENQDEKKLLYILADYYIEDCYKLYNEFKEKVTNAINLVPLIVAIDTGKSNTKYAYKQFNIETGEFDAHPRTNSFPSRVSEALALSATGMSSELVIDGQSYIVASSEAEQVCSSDDIHATGRTKAHDYHRVLKIEALRRIVNETGRTVFNAVIGCSLDSYNSDKGASVYFKMINYEIPADELYVIGEDGQEIELDWDERMDLAQSRMNELMNSFGGVSYDISYGKDDYNIRINDLIICPETISSAMAFGDVNFQSEEYHNSFIIDIGGLNRTVVAYAGGVVVKLSVNEYGMAYMINRAKDFLTSKAGDYAREKFDFTYIERVLKLYELKDTNQPVDKYLYHYFDGLMKELGDLDNASFNPSISKLIFVGGTTQSLQAFIGHYFKTEYDLTYKVDIAENGLVSNVIGMYHFGEKKFEERNKRRQKAIA